MSEKQYFCYKEELRAVVVHYPELIKTTGKHEGNVEFGLTADSINSKLKQQQIRKKEASHENVMNKNKRVKIQGPGPSLRMNGISCSLLIEKRQDWNTDYEESRVTWPQTSHLSTQGQTPQSQSVGVYS